MSDAAGAKAISAVSSGKVRELPHARTFGVESSSGDDVYLVTRAVVESAADGVRLRTACTCEAGRHGRSCWHVRAAELMARRAPAGLQGITTMDAAGDVELHGHDVSVFDAGGE